MVDTITRLEQPVPTTNTGRAVPRWFGVALLAMAAGLVLNTVIGPLLADVVDYPFSATIRNETVGLEAVSALVVAPLFVWSAVLGLRDDWRGAVLALGPSAYVVYMFVQYVAGPQYLTYQPVTLLHLAVFALAGALLIRAWTLTAGRLPARSLRSHRRWAVALGAMSLFILMRWSMAWSGMADRAAIEESYLDDPGMHWTIFLLDLGVIVPAALVTALGLWVARPWSATALYALMGWFALVPPSVTTMGVVKHLNGDPFAPGFENMTSLAVGGVVFVVLAVILYRPLFRKDRLRRT